MIKFKSKNKNHSTIFKPKRISKEKKQYQNKVFFYASISEF